MKRVVSLFLLLAVFVGSVARGNQQGSEGNAVPFTQLGLKRTGARWSFTNNSGILEPLQVVIQDRKAWEELWKRMYPHNPPPTPPVDFSRDMLIVVAMGQQNTGGFGIIVDSIYERDDKLHVLVKSISPGPKCATTQSLTQPVDIVRLLKSGQSVIFRETSARKDCGM